MPIGIALIGSGIFAQEQHLPAITATPSLTLKAIYSRTLKSAQALGEGLAGVELYSEDSEGKGYEELLQREDIGGVVIALPILAQPSYIRKALTANKHVLAEKPIAKDVATASELISWYTERILSSPPNPSPNPSPPIFAIAENFRYLDSFVYASQQIALLGRILGFRTRVNNLVTGGKYFETAWRKVPEYQGGFLLDGGVHFIAATRLMLGEGNQPVRTSAFTSQLQPHLPPVDTLTASVQLASGVSGTMDISFGTTFKGSEYAVACEGGSVWVSKGKVVVTDKEGKESVREFPEEGSGVVQEVKAWGESLERGKVNEEQSPEQALEDLKLLEAMLRSGEQGGKVMDV
ncbi:NAD(P)-binding protein [Amniculicola lignicola CBS 123094]|uniref:NAD(P)-binding protein n=1 Tax=Amniculicola lignicola CBS 123094 TaxID=1392246 RepID=A0A6A5X1R2_9PLEO|nr:NAD(P)-binding protein [Amniculicola lignicola CBS 123094]